MFANLPDGSDVVQASPFYTVVSAAGSPFFCKDCRCGLVCTRQLESAAIMDRKIETPLSLFLVSVVSLNASTKDKSLSWRGLSALSFYREGRALHSQHAKHTHRKYTSPQARLGPWARKLSTPTQSSTVSEVVEVVRLWSDQHATWDWIR